MTQFMGGCNLLADAYAAENHTQCSKGRKQKVASNEWVVPVTKKAKFDGDFATIQELMDFKAAPQYEYAQGMVLTLTKEAAVSLKQYFKRQEDEFKFHGSAQGFYWLVCYDKNKNGVWKQAVEDLGGGPGKHGFFMQYNQTPTYKGWYLSKMILKDGEHSCYGEIAGWFGNTAGDMSAPLHMPFHAPTALHGVKIVPFTEYIDKRISYVLLMVMGAYIELEVRGAMRYYS